MTSMDHDLDLMVDTQATRTAHEDASGTPDHASDATDEGSDTAGESSGTPEHPDAADT